MRDREIKETTTIVKKEIYLAGSIQLPLSIGKRAWIISSGQTIITSAVIQIMELSTFGVVFETCHSVYKVYHAPTPMGTEVRCA